MVTDENSLLYVHCAGHVCLDISPLYGPRVVESGQEAAIELTCSFSHNASELNQLDVKCYFQVYSTHPY